jgi:hypothetical protein
VAVHVFLLFHTANIYVVSPEIKVMTQFKIKLIMEYWKNRREQEAPSLVHFVDNLLPVSCISVYHKTFRGCLVKCGITTGPQAQSFVWFGMIASFVIKNTLQLHRLLPHQAVHCE